MSAGLVCMSRDEILDVCAFESIKSPYTLNIVIYNSRQDDGQDGRQDSGHDGRQDSE